VRAQLSKLVPRLASPFPGEAAATAAAIERTLRANGLDIHDLNAALGLSAPPSRPQPPNDDVDDCKYISSARLLEIVAGIQRRNRQINESSRGFLNQLSRLSLHCDPVRLSSKQYAWLDNLARQAGIAA
jgi:hypothetical protein